MTEHCERLPKCNPCWSWRKGCYDEWSQQFPCRSSKDQMNIEQRCKSWNIECKWKAFVGVVVRIECVDPRGKLKDGCRFKNPLTVYLILCFFLYSDKILSALVILAASSHLSSADE